jgi:predicted nucleic acid-binding protein
MEKLVFDTSAVLNFGKRGELEFLLERLAEGHVLLTTREVEREIADPENLKYYRGLLKRRFRVQELKTAKIELARFRQLAGVLGSGELSVLVLASELRATVVLDDKTARKEAVALKLKVTGTLGILAIGTKRKWCNDGQCIEAVRRLQTNGFRVRRPGANETFAAYFAGLGK